MPLTRQANAPIWWSSAAGSSGATRVSEAVFHADGSSDEGRAIELRTLCQNAADAPGQCTDLVLLGGDDNSRLSRRTNDRFGIDGIEGVNIQNAGLVAEFLLQDVRGAHRLGNHRSAGNDAEILILILIG